MGLRVWNALADRYNHDQLADNFAKIDFHDHSPGRGQLIPTEGIADGAVTADKIAPDAIGLVPDNSVTNAKMADNAIGTNELVNLSVTNAKLANSAVSGTKIEDGAITLAKMGINSVSTDQYVDDSIQAVHLQSNSVTASKVADNAVATAKVIDANITPDKLSASALDAAAISSTAIKRRDKFILATTETRDSSVSGTGYGLMPTADRVTGITLPANGLLTIVYQAKWEETVEGAARAAIFIGNNQLKIASGANHVVQEAECYAQANDYAVLHTSPQGLTGATLTTDTSDFTFPSTGMVVGSVDMGTGGACVIYAAQGTFDISIQFKASSGSVRVKDRRLWVKAESY